VGGTTITFNFFSFLSNFRRTSYFKQNHNRERHIIEVGFKHNDTSFSKLKQPRVAKFEGVSESHSDQEAARNT
jgi:hypothetical protein